MRRGLGIYGAREIWQIDSGKLICHRPDIGSRSTLPFLLKLPRISSYCLRHGVPLQAQQFYCEKREKEKYFIIELHRVRLFGV
jgi:hypothetical protein